MRDAPVAVILAAGVGVRLGAETPKQFLEVGGIPVLGWTAKSLAWCERLVVVHHPEYEERTRNLLEQVGVGTKVTLVTGGSTRRQSVAAALAALSELSDNVPLVLQNAASPNTPRQLVQQCLRGLEEHEIVQAYVPAVHTIFTHDDSELIEVLPRAGLGYSVDPTVYLLGCLRRITAAQADGLSEGEMTLDTARALGVPVRLVVSPQSNLKLTTAYDLVVLRALLAPPPGDDSPHG